VYWLKSLLMWVDSFLAGIEPGTCRWPKFVKSRALPHWAMVTDASPKILQDHPTPVPPWKEKLETNTATFTCLRWATIQRSARLFKCWLGLRIRVHLRWCCWQGYGLGLFEVWNFWNCIETTFDYLKFRSNFSNSWETWPRRVLSVTWITL